MFSNFIDSLRLPFQKDKIFRKQLHAIFGFYPHQLEVYRIAFAHKSHVYRNQKGRSYNNERLEFLGDAILEAVVSDIVFHHFERRPEGFLTSTRSKIVQRSTLNRLARDLGIDSLIRMPKHRGHNSYIGGNAFEALVGAAYIDRGYKCCKWFITHKIIGKLLDLDGVANKEVNFKSKLLEWCQKNKIEQNFQDTEASEADTASPVFHSKVKIEGLMAGEGKGYSKKESQQVAAREALTKLRREPQFIDRIFGEKEKRTAMEAVPVCVLPKIDVIEEAIEAEMNAKLENRRSTSQKPKNSPKPANNAKKQNAQEPAAAKEEKATTEKPKGNSRRRTQSRPAKANETAAAPEKNTPVAEKAAPVVERPVPVAEKAASVAEKAAPVVVETPAASVEKKTASEEKQSAPEEKQSAPVAKKSASVEKKTAPEEKLSALVAEKSAPLETAQQSEQPVEAAAKTAKPRKGRRGAARRSPNRPAATPSDEVAAAEPVVETKQEAAAPTKEEKNPAKENTAPAKEEKISAKEAAAPTKEEKNPAKENTAPAKEEKNSAKDASAPAREEGNSAREANAPVEGSKSTAASSRRRTSSRRPRAQRPQASPEEQAAAEKAREELIRAAEDAAFAEND
ncbi:MAG: ribonuclease III [Bacteroidales bacterium]|nr:ribonuclease III [Bacteroidales bacterium]